MKSLLFAIFLAAFPFTAPAVTRSWSGGGADDNFSNPANWSPVGAPLDGDSLVFPAGTVADTVNNNLTGRSFASISIQKGLTLTGSAFTLTGGLTVNGGLGAVRAVMSPLIQILPWLVTRPLPAAGAPS